MTVTLRQLRYFKALVEAGHFGIAAERMHVSQPALSVQIKELELTLGDRLVERLPREIRLTPRGRAVLARTERILTEVTELESAARRDGPDAVIRLGVIPTVAPYLLPAVFEDLAARGQVRLQLREAQTATLTAELLDGRLDALLMAQPDRDPRLAAQPLFEDRFLLAGTAPRLARVAARIEHLRPALLDPDDLLLLDEGHCLADQALEVCGLDRNALRVDLGAASLATLCRLVAADHGLTLLPELALASECAASPEIALRRFETPEPRRVLALVRRAGAADEPWVRDLADLLTRAGRRVQTAAAQRA
ncbi:LysR substrate-binding domain-containing protein [Fluviibacterium sp. DFM31]|uniref:LysR substrate-binding domain-containing protein n=1 Tax=Meridianimarinicoccus marinus TaxID=3231483 RepID=A0ABV3L1W3_9RHOB